MWMKKIYVFILLLNLSIFDDSPFKQFYQTNLTDSERISLFLNTLGAKRESCLASVDDTIKILDKKYGIKADKTNITKNLRFIVGDCNPVIIIPGIFSVRLRVQIDCKGLYNNEMDVYSKLKFYCFFNLCLNPDKYDDVEEYELF